MGLTRLPSVVLYVRAGRTVFRGGFGLQTKSCLLGKLSMLDFSTFVEKTVDT